MKIRGVSFECCGCDEIQNQNRTLQAALACLNRRPRFYLLWDRLPPPAAAELVSSQTEVTYPTTEVTESATAEPATSIHPESSYGQELGNTTEGTQAISLVFLQEQQQEQEGVTQPPAPPPVLDEQTQTLGGPGMLTVDLDYRYSPYRVEEAGYDDEGNRVWSVRFLYFVDIDDPEYRRNTPPDLDLGILRITHINKPSAEGGGIQVDWTGVTYPPNFLYRYAITIGDPTSDLEDERRGDLSYAMSTLILSSGERVEELIISLRDDFRDDEGILVEDPKAYVTMRLPYFPPVPYRPPVTFDDEVENQEPDEVIPPGPDQQPTMVYSIPSGQYLYGQLMSLPGLDQTKVTYELVEEARPQAGRVEVYDNGEFTYQSNPGFTGTDSFAVRVTDGTTTYIIVVLIRVIAPEVLPLAQEDPEAAISTQTDSGTAATASDLSVLSELLDVSVAPSGLGGTESLEPPDGSLAAAPQDQIPTSEPTA